MQEGLSTTLIPHGIAWLCLRAPLPAPNIQCLSPLLCQEPAGHTLPLITLGCSNHGDSASTGGFSPWPHPDGYCLLFAVVFVSLCSTSFCSFGNPANNVFSPAGLTKPGCKINPVPLSSVWRRGGAPYGAQSHHITETKSLVGRCSAPVMCWLGHSGRFSTHRDKPLSFSGSSFPLYVSAWLRCSHVMLLYPP